MTKKIIIIISFIVIMAIGLTLYFSRSSNARSFNSIIEASSSGLKLSCVDSTSTDVQIFVEGNKYKYTINGDKNEPFTQLFDGDTLYSFNPNGKQGIKLSKNCLGQTSNADTKKAIEGKLMPFDPGTYNCKEIGTIDFSLPASANWIDGCQIMLKRDNPEK